jgi:hypothetical protein
MSSNLEEYLEVIGATAICIVKMPGGYAIRVGREAVNIEGVVNIHWTSRPLAAKIARNARHNAGPAPEKGKLEHALQVAASNQKQTLTPHLVLMSRATKCANDLQAALRDMAKSGRLEAFHREYKRRRQDAKRNGRGFASYNAAMRRLRRSLIRRLTERVPVWAPGLFEEVFLTLRPPKRQKTVDGGLDAPEIHSRDQSDCCPHV